MAERIRPSDEVVQENIKKWNIPQPDKDYMVLIHCSTYNHGKYIEDALKGFVMQKTNFPFCAIVIDDCSTDNTAEIVRKYAVYYPDIIKPILLGENHMQHGVLRDPYFEKWHQCAKYMAECEGDDYWTDPYKLQKQLDFMETHPNCTLCFHANIIRYPTGKEIVHRPTRIKDFYNTRDAILGGGGFMATNSMFYRMYILNQEGKPDFWKNAPIGDATCMLYFASKGYLGYIDDVMSVYRLQTEGSWSSAHSSFEARKNHYTRIIRMFDEYDEYTNHKYHCTIVLKKIRNRIGYLKNWIVSTVSKHF